MTPGTARRKPCIFDDVVLKVRLCRFWCIRSESGPAGTPREANLALPKRAAKNLCACFQTTTFGGPGQAASSREPHSLSCPRGGDTRSDNACQHWVRRVSRPSRSLEGRRARCSPHTATLGLRGRSAGCEDSRSRSILGCGAERRFSLAPA